MLHRRRAWFEAQPGLDPDRLIFADKTGASTKMARRCGRAVRGRRCPAPVPHGHWKTTTFVGALRLGGMTAPMTLDGAMHVAVFLFPGSTWSSTSPNSTSGTTRGKCRIRCSRFWRTCFAARPEYEEGAAGSGMVGKRLSS